MQVFVLIYNLSLFDILHGVHIYDLQCIFTNTVLFHVVQELYVLFKSKDDI